jgi:WD40-like Beta Propeller Repeat
MTFEQPARVGNLTDRNDLLGDQAPAASLGERHDKRWVALRVLSYRYRSFIRQVGFGCAPCSDGPQASLFVRDAATGRGRLLGKLDRAENTGFTVSPDGKTILYTRQVGEGLDLMMIDNFR